MEKSNFHKSLMSSKKGAVTSDKVMSIITVGAMIGIGIPVLYTFFSDWALDANMPAWLITAGPAFLGLAVLTIVVGIAKSKK